MKVRGLQQQLAASNYLLPSQRELLSRLLFQLAFNDFKQLAVFGVTGSGKSTLALSLAELFSDCQEMSVNVALLQAPMATEQLVTQLAKQWFAAPNLSAVEVAQRLQTESAATEWILIIDDPEQLTPAQTDWLLSLTARVFLFAKSAQDTVQLNLAIPALTLADSEQLLQAETLNTLGLAERFANSQGNLHQLLAKAPRQSARSVTPVEPKKPKIAAAIGAALVVLVLIALGLNRSTESKVSELPVVMLEDKLPTPATPLVAASDELIPALQPELDGVDVLPEDINTIDESAHSAESELEIPIIAVDVAPITETAIAAEDDTIRTPDLDPEPMAKTVSDPPTEPIAVVLPYDHQLLLDLPARNLVVQLAVVSGESAITRFKQRYPQLQILVYQRSWQGKTQWIIVSRPFQTNAAAKQWVDQLPASLSASGPFIKSARAVQQEILAWQRLNLAKTN